MQNSFSIIIPTYNRQLEVQRAIRSVLNQDYLEKEIIVVNDGSIDESDGIIRRFEEVKYHRFASNHGRLAARNVGMKSAKNDWICWLDSDDEYVSTYLQVLNKAINDNPEYKIFNFGAIVYDESNLRSYTRGVFRPDISANGSGHVKFKSGGIGTGSFIFRRELLEEVGYFPETVHPYGGDDSFPALATARWPELRELYGQNEQGEWLPFGNPWGDDWLMFYLLTRKHLSIPLDWHGYIQHLRK